MTGTQDMPHLPDIDAVRAQFPSLAREMVLLENAGGSQVPWYVADAIRDHLLNDYVQLGAGYPASDRATATVERAHRFMDRFVNGEGLGRVILGSSCTSLMHVLAHSISRTIQPGDEIVVCEQGHEANIGCWLELERYGAVIRWWRVSPETGSLDLEDLRSVLSERTRIVAFPHVSNLLGEIVDVKAVATMVHAAGGRVVVDGVAYAPHRAIDVRDWNVDFYTWSTYKVYGPHMGGLFARHDAIAELQGPNHFFIPEDEIPYKFELGGVSHEGCAGLCALPRLLAFLANDKSAAAADAETCDFEVVQQAFAAMAAMEAPVQKRLLERLSAHDSVRIVGPVSDDIRVRVSTVSMVHASIDPRRIVEIACSAGFGIRHGHMYAHRLCTQMQIETDPGVVRISPVHYNTVSEIDRLCDVLEETLSK